MTAMTTVVFTAAFTGDFARIGSAFLTAPRTVPVVVRPAITPTAASGMRLVPAAAAAGKLYLRKTGGPAEILLMQ
jgi:hypothetical protein